MQKLDPPDSYHLDAAIGWLGLGCAGDARVELEKVEVANQNHPDVLEALGIAGLELQLAPADPAGWLHRAYALRRGANGSLPQAWDALLPAAEKFPGEPVIPYNLSCYACQLKQLDASRIWLKRAMKVGGKAAIKKMALADDDLKPLWPEIEGL